MSLELRGGNIQISDKDDDFEIEIIVESDGVIASQFINVHQAKQIIDHLKEQYQL